MLLKKYQLYAIAIIHQLENFRAQLTLDENDLRFIKPNLSDNIPSTQYSNIVVNIIHKIIVTNTRGTNIVPANVNGFFWLWFYLELPRLPLYNRGCCCGEKQTNTASLSDSSRYVTSYLDKTSRVIAPTT